MPRSGQPQRHAFVDESRRGAVYLLTAVLIPSRDLRQVTRAVRDGLPKGRQRTHFTDEGDAARNRILSRYCSLTPEVVIVTAQCGPDEEGARQLCLRALLGELARRRVAVLVLDTRGERDHHDRETIAAGLKTMTADLHYSHRGSKDELLLGLPDAFGWCYGIGRNWRKRVAPFIAAEIHA